MYEILYATGNTVKFHQGELVCKRYNIQLLQNELDVPEIQSEDGRLIARDKAEKAFAELHKPVYHIRRFVVYPCAKRLSGRLHEIYEPLAQCRRLATTHPAARRPSDYLAASGRVSGCFDAKSLLM